MIRRTSLLMDGALYAALKARAAREGRTLAEVVEQALRAGLVVPGARRPRRALPSYDLGPFLSDPSERGAALEPGP